MIREHVIFLPKTEAPVHRGWFYGRMRTAGASIVPFFVDEHPTRHVLVTMSGHHVSQLDWFGPLPEVRESGA